MFYLTELRMHLSLPLANTFFSQSLEAKHAVNLYARSVAR